MGSKRKEIVTQLRRNKMFQSHHELFLAEPKTNFNQWFTYLRDKRQIFTECILEMLRKNEVSLWFDIKDRLAVNNCERSRWTFSMANDMFNDVLLTSQLSGKDSSNEVKEVEQIHPLSPFLSWLKRLWLHVQQECLQRSSYPLNFNPNNIKSSYTWDCIHLLYLAGYWQEQRRVICSL